MPYLYPVTRTIRFDFPPSLPKTGANLVVKFKPEGGLLDDGKIGVGIRWTINFTDDNGAELAGQLSETRSFFEKESEENDMKSLKDFVYNSFLNVESYYDDNKPIAYRNIRLSQPDTDHIAKRLYDLIRPQSS